MTSNVAAIDCGTNSTRVLIADAHGATLCREMRITRLGQDVDATGVLAAEALARTYGVLTEYAELLRQFEVGRATLVATSAARDATNGPAFLSEAERITGAAVAVLTGTEEARLSYVGATHDLEPTSVPVMIVDIGGGSTELAAEIEGVFTSYSMQIGCVRVTERALGAGVVDDEHADAARRMIDEQLTLAFARAPALASLVGHVRLVGLAGTVSTLAQLDAGLSTYDRTAVHHRELTRHDVTRWRSQLSSESPEVRLAHPGMVPGREDVLVSGLFILDAVMERFACSSLLTSECDILDGLVATLL